MIAKQSGISFEGIVMAESETGDHRTGMVNPDGSFTIAGLTPGPYKLDYSTQDGKRTAEKVVKAPAAGVVLELLATGEIHGRVIDKATNAALPQFSAVAQGNGARGIATDEFEGADTFTLSVEPGFTSVTVRAEGYISETQQVTVDEKKPATVTFALTRGRTISGRVTNETGSAVAGARVYIESDDYQQIASAESSQDGEFELAGARREPVTLAVEKQGFVSQPFAVSTRPVALRPAESWPGESDRRRE